MRALSIILGLALLVGGVAAAIWMSQRPPSVPPKNLSGNTKPFDVEEPSQEKKAPRNGSKEKPIPVVAPTGPYPKAVADEREYDFGTMQMGSQGSHVFIIRNDGEAPLEVVAREEDTTCQCTVGKVGNEKAVPPGEEVTVELKWEIKSQNPNFRHTAKIRTNDPENQVIELAITGRVDQTFHLIPSSVWELGTATEGASAKAVGTLFSRLLDKFEITEFVCPNPRVTCTWQPIDEASRREFEALSGYTLVVRVDLSDVVGQFQEFAEIRTDAAEPVAARFAIRARNPGAFDVIARNWDPEHSMLLLGEFPAAEGKTGELSFYTQLEEDVELVAAVSEHNAIKATWTKDEKFQSRGKSKRYLLKLEVLPGQPVNRKRKQAERLDLKFNHPKLGSMTIYVDYLSI
jgi:hypothetical protein